MILNPKITFLIPCYNAEEYLTKALNCVINQTYKNLEVLTIDDGSSDKTLAILKQFAEKDKRVKVIQNETNLGLIRTLNKGINLATGEYIARFDADDLIDTNRIELQISRLNQNANIDLLTSKAIYITHQDYYHSKVDHFYCTLPKAIKFVALFECPLLHAGLIVKTDVLKQYKYNFTNEAKHIEDYDLFSRLLIDNLNIAVDASKALFYQYRRNINSVSNHNRNTQSENTLQLSKKNLHTILQIEIESLLHEIIYLKITKTYTVKQINKAIDALKNTAQKYFQQEAKTITQAEKTEINNWISLRIFKIILTSFIKGNLLVKLNCMVMVVANVNILFSKFVGDYATNRVFWLKSKLLYKV
ncbi:MAG: glycosyltransferase family A protein [Bacteroidota bacterium]